MAMPSLTVILSAATAAYVAHSIWTLVTLFYPTPCPDTSARCITSFLDNSPALQLQIYTSLKYRPTSENDLTHIYTKETFDPNEEFEVDLNITLPKKTRNNGTLHCMVYLLGPGQPLFNRDRYGTTVTARATLTLYMPLQPDTFNLIGGSQENETTPEAERPTEPVTHWRSKMLLNVMTQSIGFEPKSVPGDIHRFMRVTDQGEYLPILYIDEFGFRTRDLMPVNSTSKVMPFNVKYEPISIGKLRLWSNMQQAFSSLHGLGFTEKDTDEVKGIFADTNFYFLMLTFIVSALHLLFDFLAFKNDISYWKNRKDMVGLSSKTVVWRCVSTFIIFLYLLDQDTSLLVLIPAGIASLIEVWKVKKAFKLTISWRGWRPGFEFGMTSDREKATQDLDTQAMKYLSFVLWPLVLGGAVYSLIYTPHKSWYSWCVQTLVNGIYAFGFLFMLPQLFLNYKLKSVAHLPWRAFMYKAFNTFIDDVFAFIITMPTAHRLACFRDDVVFVIYLYQRWLYPIDKTRVNEFGQSFEDEDKSRDSDVTDRKSRANDVTNSGDAKLQSKKDR